MLANAVHGIGDPYEVLEEVESIVLILIRIVVRQNDSNLQHVLTIKRHPRSPVRLFQRTSCRQGRATIKHTNVVEAEKPTRKDIASVGILAVYPPIEVEHQSSERAFQKLEIRSSKTALHFEKVKSGPRMNRRIHVAEVPLICRNLPVRVTIETAEHQQKLLFSKIEINE